MYPHSYLGLFPPFPRKDRVFVAMSFDGRFTARWNDVIEPAIREASVDNVTLQPHRVDAAHISESVLTDILDGISNDRIIFADVTAIGDCDGRTIRNGNVMYELGIAHASRLPEEVVIFRSDPNELPFDIANVRVNHYDPDSDPVAAKLKISKAIEAAIQEIARTRHLAVRATSQSLDALGWAVLSQACEDSSVHHFETRTLAQALSNTPRNAAIARLLASGVLETDCTTPIREIIRAKAAVDRKKLSDDKLFAYRPTPFGRAVHQYFLGKVYTSMLVETILQEFPIKEGANVETRPNSSVEDGVPNDKGPGDAG